MIEFPEKKEANNSRINSMLIVSRPKIGKTESLLQLPDSILIDLDNSAGYYGGVYLSVDEICLLQKKGPISVMMEIAKTLQDENKKIGKHKYKFGIIDTISKLEEHCESYATYLYTQTNQGKGFTGKNVVTELEYGAGYGWLRTALEMTLNPFFTLFDTLILTSHVKDSSINVKGSNIGVSDVNLTGKIKGIITSKTDAIGVMYRHPEKVNTNMLSFKTNPADIITGARPPHLSNQEFEISTKDPQTGVLSTFWKQIFLEI